MSDVSRPAPPATQAPPSQSLASRLPDHEQGVGAWGDDAQKALLQLPIPGWRWNIGDSQLQVNSCFQRTFGNRITSLEDLLKLLSQSSREALLAQADRALSSRRPFNLEVELQRYSDPERQGADRRLMRSLWGVPVVDSRRQQQLLCMLLSETTSASGGMTQDWQPQGMELQLLLDSIRSVIWYMDRHGRVQHGNQRAADWMPLPQAMGLSFADVAPDWEDAAVCQEQIRQVVDSGEALLNSLERRCVAGQYHWYRVDKIPTHGVDGEVSGVLLVITEVTEVILKEQALQESEARYKAFIANSSEAMYRFDMLAPVATDLAVTEQARLIAEQGVLAECNHVLARIFDSEPRLLLGHPLASALGDKLSEALTRFVQQDYRLTDYEFSYLNNDGEKVSYQLSAIGIVEGGYLQRLWGTGRDVTERKRYLERLEYQAAHDSLTLLPNRNRLYQEVEQLLVTRSSHQKFALLLLDLDRFKEINDTLGHHAGDKLLKQIGPRLEMELSEMPAMVARLGGDEFAILLPRIRNNQQAVVIAHRVLDAIRQPFEVEGLHTEISVSIGIAICPEQAQDVSTLMRYADVAMYHAKSERKGVSVYQVDYDTHTPKRLALMSDLGRAIREDQLQLYFQPKVNLAEHRVYGFEALLRWNHPQMGFIPPGEFIPLVEMTDLVQPMTLWVLENSIAQASRWQRQGYCFSVAANLSAQNLLGEALVEKLEQLLFKYQLPPERLELEITESAIMVDPDRALRVLKGIDALGITLAIDDFGTGYSSLAYLKRLPVRSLKIDGSFVTGMLEEEQDEIIVHSTINLAHNLGLRVVAEGVEDEQVLARLQQLNCDYAQGYFIARPQPADQVQQWLEQGGWLPNS